MVGPRPTLISHAGHHARTAAVIKAQRGTDGRNCFETKIVETGR